ncbi:hypothetical protein ACS0TY_005314 [Phlomoides rotata]
MESGDNSCLGVKRARKAKPGGGIRRSWIELEEIIPMEALKELVASGNWKTENGFRPGYLQKLEEKLNAKMSGTDIRANPHIHSKIITWKKLHGCLQTTLCVTSCGFNLNTKVFDVSNSTWATVLKKDPSVSGMRYKP